jgi:polar amino acid transport system permease protein
MTMEFDALGPKYLGWLINGFWITLLLSLLASLLGSVLGLVLAVARSSSWALLWRPAWAYIALFRNTPLLVQLFFWYFGFTSLLPEELVLWLNAVHHLVLPGGREWMLPGYEYLIGVIALGLFASAFIAEEIRAGLRGVPHAQRQAALALGMTPTQAMRHVVLPQAVRIALPPLLGQYMNVIKSSSLTMAIGVMELSYASRQVETATFKTFQAYAVSTVLYILTIALLETLGQFLHRRMHVASQP